MGDADRAAGGAAKRYRLRVRAPDGQEITSSVIELLSSKAKLKSPAWADGLQPVTTAHKGELSMRIEGVALEGRTVRFNVERLEDGAWVAHGVAHGVVKGGVALAAIAALHPAAGGAASGVSRAPVPLRFKAELI